MVQADRLGPEVGGHLAPCCIHHANQSELSQCFKHDDSTIKIVLALLLLLLLTRTLIRSFYQKYRISSALIDDNMYNNINMDSDIKYLAETRN